MICENRNSWLRGGEKYALLGLNGHVLSFDGIKDIGGGLLALPHFEFVLPDHWPESLGKIRSESIQSYNLFVLRKTVSAAPTVLDGENKDLISSIEYFYRGLQLSRKLRLYATPFIASGGWNDLAGIDVRRYLNLTDPGDAVVKDLSPISMSDLERAALIGERLKNVVEENRGSKWRLLRCHSVFQDASNSHDILERIHQFTRCIDGLVLSEPGKGRKQFKERTELFVGPQGDLMEEVYNLRSSIEHLREHEILEVFERGVRIRIAELEAMVEWIARSCLVRIVSDPVLTQHFSTADSARKFWTLPKAEQETAWGDPINPHVAVNDFDPSRVSDQDLGRPVSW